MTEMMSGTEPAAYVEHEFRLVRKEGAEPSALYSEIEDGIFVAWDVCRRCMQHVSQCKDKDGPQEPAHITRWRQARFENSLRARPAPEVADRQVLGSVVETLQRYGLTVVEYEPPAVQTPARTEFARQLTEAVKKSHGDDPPEDGTVDNETRGWYPPLPGDQPNETDNIPIGQTEDETPEPESDTDWKVDF